MSSDSESALEARTPVVLAARPTARAGARVEICCAACGYGGVVSRLPGRCPMCGSSAWRERAPKSGVSSIAEAE